MPRGGCAALLCWTIFLVFAMNACQWFSRGQVLYERQGMQVGLQTDPSIARSSPPASNAHPVLIKPESLALLLSAIRVSGWSGTIIGYFESPPRLPLFDDAELRLITPPLVEALGQANPAQRVFFYVPNPSSTYGDATAGFLFARDAFLHLVLTDHKALARADTGGGEVKDPRDMKGMRLWVAAPYRRATVPPAEQPEWAPFETVHISVNLEDAMAPPTEGGRAAREVGIKPTRAPHADDGEAAESSERTPADLQLQIRELTQSNLDLRERLNRQTRELQELKDELARLRHELDRAKRKAPSVRKPAAP